jgi:hypothetical protein
MEIEIIRSQESPLDPTRYFGILLSKALSIIHMIHWYTPNYNMHLILGDLYGDLDDLFDSLQEEIIGTSKMQEISFPGFHSETFDLEDISQYATDFEHLMDVYNQTVVKLIAIINSPELGTYIESVVSGLNNTKEDILSRINKANYLLAML